MKKGKKLASTLRLKREYERCQRETIWIRQTKQECPFNNYKRALQMWELMLKGKMERLKKELKERGVEV